PSVDAVGRSFPLAVVAALPQPRLDPLGALFAAAPWFSAVEEIALRAIAPRASVAEIDAGLAHHPFAAEGRNAVDATALWMPGSARLAGASSAWLAEESEVLPRSLLLCEGLPAGDLFCAMMDGRWSEHGWSRRELERLRA